MRPSIEVIAKITNIGVTDRIRHLKEKLLSTKPSVCTERASIYTDVYKKHEAKPVILKRAVALRETLKNMTIFIDDGELIVGNQSSKLRAAPIFPEYAVTWILNELDEFDKRPGDAFQITEKEKEELREICSYWQGKTLYEQGMELMPEQLKEIQEAKIIHAEGNLTSGDAHLAVNFEKLLQEGINASLDLIDRKRAELDVAKKKDVEKEVFYQAEAVGLTALREFIRRFEHLAFMLCEVEKDERRKKELRTISENCTRIAEHPPETFFQALQLTYFVQLVLQIESNGHSVSLGRVDQYLYPFYQKDRDACLLSDEFAVELLENTWLKLLSINKIRSWSHTRYSAGSPLYQNVTIGGQTPDGKDAVNELSYLILHSVGKMKLTQPNLSIRYHRNISDDFMTAAVKVIEKGFGMPAFNNDEIVIPALIDLGVEQEDAYNYSAIGCIEVAVPGKWGYRCTGMSFLNLMLVFLAAMRNGDDTESGKTFHPGTGTFEDFTDFDEVMKAWREQIEFYTWASVAIDTAVDTAIEKSVPDVLCSALVDDCLERGKTIKEGGAKYDFVSGLQVGIANLGNSLAAIKKLVFEDKKISQSELMQLLDTDFEGPEGEKLRQIVLNHAPKYGNDDDYVEELLREAFGYFIDTYKQFHNTRYGRGPIGGGYYAGTSSISANVPSGAAVPATPDGRKAYTPLAEGSSPSSGTDRLGPTAVFKSVSKLPTTDITGGVLLNQKLSPASTKKEQDKKKLISLIRTFFDDLKGWHVQYNIVSRDTLIKAKEKPEEHRDLVVRVAGYSAFFTTLSPDTQDDIIARTEHVL